MPSREGKRWRRESSLGGTGRGFVIVRDRTERNGGRPRNALFSMGMHARERFVTAHEVENRETARNRRAGCGSRADIMLSSPASMQSVRGGDRRALSASWAHSSSPLGFESLSERYRRVDIRAKAEDIRPRSTSDSELLRNRSRWTRLTAQSRISMSLSTSLVAPGPIFLPNQTILGMMRKRM